MKKKHLLTKILSVCSLSILLTGCTTLSYVDDDFDTVRTKTVQTEEQFSINTVGKALGDVDVWAGVSETSLDQALVLYLQIQNNTDSMYKFDVADISVTSPIGDVSIIPPSVYIEAYQNFEAQNYAGLMNAGTTLNSFANIQNQYRQAAQSTSTTIENLKLSPELMLVEKNIANIQKHTLSSYKFLDANSSEYFYIFIRKPEEYPIVVKYKGLSYKFGGKRNAKQ